MTTATRRGSFLLACISMMALMVIVGFALLRNVRLQTDASTATQRVLLSQSAAEAGVAHASEQILKDYVSQTISVRSGSGGTDHSIDLPARQFLQGPYRAPFTAMTAPDVPDYDLNALDSDKDVRTEHHLLRPWVLPGYSWDYSWETTAMSHQVGRARYYEPNYYNLTRQTTAPVDPTSFIDLKAAVPERSEGMFYDDQFRRIDKDPATARTEARYRLRYAVSVEDLNGHLLINPLADMTLPDDYRTPPNWVSRAADALSVILTTQCGGPGWATPPNSSSVGAHAEHVFLGRGWFGNVDQDANGFPITFPRMYRFGNPAVNVDWSVYNQNYYVSTLAQTMYQSKYVVGHKDGGESLYCDSLGIKYAHALVGPQMSWWNFYNASALWNPENSDINNPTSMVMAATPFGRPLRRPVGYPASYVPSRRHWYDGRADTPFYVNLMTAPPWVIDGMLVAYLPPKFKIYKYSWITFQKYNGRDANGSDIWITNLPGSGMAIDGEDPRNNSGQYGRDLLVDTTSPVYSEFAAPQRDGSTPAPLTSAANEVVKPDYYVPDPRLPHQVGATTVSAMDKVYPGLAWNGDPNQMGQGTDDAGACIDTDTIGYGYCVHTNKPFVHLDPGAPSEPASDYPNRDTMAPADWQASNVTVEPPAWWKDKTDPNSDRNTYVKSPDPHRLRYQDSYWWDIYCAMSTAIAATRAQWVQYDTGYFKMAGLFPSGQRDPSRYQTLRDVDRLFLAELGESLDAPGTGAPTDLSLTAFKMNWVVINNVRQLTTPTFIPYLASNNIKSGLMQDLLKSVDDQKNVMMTSGDRAKVMERVLNDWRLAFFGSSPDYSDGLDPVTGVPTPALEFRPLDFDGDGIVHCSAYQDPTGQSPSPNPGLPAEAGGRGPKPDPLNYVAPTGNFFIGKSHFFRIVSRGEVWDNRFKTILNEATLESVLCVDPEGTNVKDTQTLYQRWHFDSYQGMMPHVKP